MVNFGTHLPYAFLIKEIMKPDGTPTIDEILCLVDQLQEFEKRQLIARIERGGINTLKGRFNFPSDTYYFYYENEK